MRVLLDSCLSEAAVGIVRRAGEHECEWVGDWGRDPGDDEILDHANRNEQVVVTLDKDFGMLAVVRRMPHHGIVRLVGFSARAHGDVCCQVLAQYEDELRRSALITVTPDRVRVRPAEE